MTKESQNMETYDSVYQRLYQIYNKYSRRYKENACDSREMCLMWSTNNPPDDIIGTEPFDDIESAFGICIDDDDDALDLYNMTLEEAARKIIEMKKNQSA